MTSVGVPVPDEIPDCVTPTPQTGTLPRQPAPPTPSAVEGRYSDRNDQAELLADEWPVRQWMDWDERFDLAGRLLGILDAHGLSVVHLTQPHRPSEPEGPPSPTLPDAPSEDLAHPLSCFVPMCAYCEALRQRDAR